MSYMGSGTVNPDWQQAQNLISQQVGIMVADLVDKDRQIAALKRRVTDTERALESYKEKPDSYSEGWYVKELGKAREARQELESNLRRQTEFGKLKDRAKIKVERARDEAQRKVSALEDIISLLRVRAQKADELAVMNERQAQAFAGHERMLAGKEDQVRLLRQENERLMQVIRLGREGLQREQW